MLDILPIASGSSGNAYIVSDAHTTILLECGIPFKQIQKAINFEPIDACLISHSHQDHCKAVNDILKAGIDVYMLSETKAELNLPDRHNLHTIEPHQPFYISSRWKIHPFEVSHDVPNTGYILSASLGEQIVFFTDTYYTKHTFPNTTHWIVECNFIKEKLDNNLYQGDLHTTLRNRIVKSHMSLETLKDMFKANDLSMTKEIYLTHLSDSNSDAAQMKREIQELTGKVVYVCV